MTKLDPASRWFPLLLVGLMMAGAVSIDIYLPSLPDMARLFQTDAARVQLTLSVFFAGFAVAQLVLGPLSDRFGRRPVFVGGILLYLVATVACLVASQINTLILARFFQALGACAGPVLSRAIVRDVYPPDQASRVFATLASIFAVTPALAPIVGGNLHAAFGWRANFIVMLGFGVLQLAAVRYLLPETNRHLNMRALDPLRILFNYRLLLRSRHFLGYTLMMGFTFSAMFTFVSGSPLLLIGLLGVRPEYYGLWVLLVTAGFLTGSLSVARLASRFGSERMVRIGAAIALAAGLVMAGLAWAGIETVMTVIGPAIFLFLAAAMVLPCSTALAIAPYARIAGTASALLGFLQMSLAACAGWLAAYLHDGTTIPVAGVILAVLAASACVHRVLLAGRKVP
ncbi:MAG: multidrug effflux MFS transporter [Rhodospirillaceae bacterium]|nr:multidrug effflux MFS transporter [Rhodospirillaceae bacterium]